jgi:hypothetical protein
MRKTSHLIFLAFRSMDLKSKVIFIIRLLRTPLYCLHLHLSSVISIFNLNMNMDQVLERGYICIILRMRTDNYSAFCEPCADVCVKVTYITIAISYVSLIHALCVLLLKISIVLS